MVVKLLTEHHLEFLSLKGGCRGSPESTHVKIPHFANLMSRLKYFENVCSVKVHKNRSPTKCGSLMDYQNRIKHIGLTIPF